MRMTIRFVGICMAAWTVLAGCSSSGKIRSTVQRLASNHAVENTAKGESPQDASPPSTTCADPKGTSHPDQGILPAQFLDRQASVEVTAAHPFSETLDGEERLDPPDESAEDLEPPAALPLMPDKNGLFTDAMPIDLTTALQMAAGQNPQVAFAAQRIEEAFAQLRLTQILWVPSIRTGINYNKHEGQIQDVAGNMIETSRGSVYGGLGAQAVGAGSPAIPGMVVNFHMRDAIFQPRIARHIVGARTESSRAAVNDILLQTSLAYLDLLEAVQIHSISEETVANAQRLADLTSDFARIGQGLMADADRARVELALRQIEVRRAAETTRVASARLTRLLSLPQGQTMMPQEISIAPIDLVALDAPVQELVALGLSNRPELAESQFLVGEAVQRLNRERHAPLVPSVLLGMSYGGNAGGLGSDIENFGDRMDFDAVAYWELRNLGLGERRARQDASARVEMARIRQIQVLDQVAAEVAEAHAQVTERAAQIELAKSSIGAATESYRRNTERIREGQGLPIETLQAIQALDQSRRQYVRTVMDYNRAQFTLQRALGWPVEFF